MRVIIRASITLKSPGLPGPPCELSTSHVLLLRCHLLCCDTVKGALTRDPAGMRPPEVPRLWCSICSSNRELIDTQSNTWDGRRHLQITCLIRLITKYMENSWNARVKSRQPIKKWTKALSRHFSKRIYTWTWTTGVWKCSMSPVIREVQIKTTVKYYLTPIRMAATRKHNNKCGQKCLKLETCANEYKVVQSLGKQYDSSTRN